MLQLTANLFPITVRKNAHVHVCLTLFYKEQKPFTMAGMPKAQAHAPGQQEKGDPSTSASAKYRRETLCMLLPKHAKHTGHAAVHSCTELSTHVQEGGTSVCHSCAKPGWWRTLQWQLIIVSNMIRLRLVEVTA